MREGRNAPSELVQPKMEWKKKQQRRARWLWRNWNACKPNEWKLNSEETNKTHILSVCTHAFINNNSRKKNYLHHCDKCARRCYKLIDKSATQLPLLLLLLRCRTLQWTACERACFSSAYAVQCEGFVFFSLRSSKEQEKERLNRFSSLETECRRRRKKNANSDKSFKAIPPV